MCSASGNVELRRIVSSSCTMNVENPGARREEQCGKWPVGCVLRLNAEISSNQSRNDGAAVILDRTSRARCLLRSTLKGFWPGAEASRRSDPIFVRLLRIDPENVAFSSTVLRQPG